MGVIRWATRRRPPFSCVVATHGRTAPGHGRGAGVRANGHRGPGGALVPRAGRPLKLAIARESRRPQKRPLDDEPPLKVLIGRHPVRPASRALRRIHPPLFGVQSPGVRPACLARGLVWSQRAPAFRATHGRALRQLFVIALKYLVNKKLLPFFARTGYHTFMLWRSGAFPKCLAGSGGRRSSTQIDAFPYPSGAMRLA